MYQNATFTPPAKSLTLDLSDYVREMISDMMLNMRAYDASRVIGVTNFVITSDYQSSSLIGDELANTFMMQMHQSGFQTLDFKVTDYIRITEQGDFAMSRDYLELDTNTAIDSVLVGTISDHKNGYRVFARIVDVKTKKVLAAGESFIPRMVTNTLLSNLYLQASDYTLRASS